MRAATSCGPRSPTGRSPAGAAAWAWNGKVAGGAFAKPGTYRIVVTATNGTQRAGQSTTVARGRVPPRGIGDRRRSAATRSR